MASKAPFELLPATREDIPRLAQIHVAACMTDDAFRLYFPTEDEFIRRVASMLDDQVGESTWYHIKVVDTITGQIASWASWNIPTDLEIHNRDIEVRYKATSDVTENRLATKGEFEFPEGLATCVKDKATKWVKELTFNRRHMLARALFTEPSFKRQGMATALVKYGNLLADRMGLPCCLIASAGASDLYTRHGFHVLQNHDVDLSEWMPSKDADQNCPNAYRFRYMLRLPEITSG